MPLLLRQVLVRPAALFNRRLQSARNPAFHSVYVRAIQNLTGWGIFFLKKTPSSGSSNIVRWTHVSSGIALTWLAVAPEDSVRDTQEGQNMVADILAAAAPVLSVGVAVVVTRMTIRGNISRLQRQWRQTYTKELLQKRIQHYPHLHELLNGYARIVDHGSYSQESLRGFSSEIDDWSRRYSLFFSPETSQISAAFRNYLLCLLQESEKANKIAETDWKLIRSSLGHFVQSLKADIGIFATEPGWSYQYQKRGCAELRERTSTLADGKERVTPLYF